VAEKAPWLLAKDESKRAELHVVCTLAINYFRLLATYLAPIVPHMARLVSDNFLGTATSKFHAADTLLLGHEIRPFATRIDRIDPKKIEAMIEASKESLKPTDNVAGAAAPTAAAGANAASTPSPPNPPLGGDGSKAAQSGGGTSTISIDDFAKLDLRVGKVIACEFVDGSDKLLRFELDAGELGKRQIFSGIRAAYTEPAKLIGRNVVFIANLAPRKMRFGVSEGMILSAGSGGDDLFLLDADAGALPGMPIK
jgi:methionyl-tRNA synthetase